MPHARIWFAAGGLCLAFIVAAAVHAAPPAAAAEAAVGSLWLPAIFADRMVLQREMTVPVWGRCEPQRKTFADVLVGDVWIACGQSNMGFQVATSAERDDAEARRKDFPLLRVAMAGRHNPHEVTESQADVGNGKPIVWHETSDHVGSCSAVGYYFARDLNRWLDGKVPVGVIELIAVLPVQSWADGTWHKAKATIRGPTVEVRAADVPEPEGVRYAWAGYPEVTLLNQEGLPARPFRHPTIELGPLQKECETAT